MCRVSVKWGNYNQTHQIRGSTQTVNLQRAKSGKEHASNSGDCSVYLLTLETNNESHNQQKPQKNQQRKLDTGNESQNFDRKLPTAKHFPTQHAQTSCHEKKLEETHSQTVALRKTRRTVSKAEFAKIKILQSFNHCSKGAVSLLFRQNLSLCDLCDPKTNEMETVWSIVYSEWFLF